MKIERKRFNGPDGMINKGRFGGHARCYRDALYSTLVHLQPKIICEIGTHLAQSSHVIYEYLQQYQPNGLLVTCDIKKYTNLQLNNVIQKIVYPHIIDIHKFHNVSNNEMISYNLDDINNSIMLNTQILLQDVDTYDFLFLDGSHDEISMKKDWEIAKNILKEPKYIFLDDTEEYEHYTARFFHEQIKQDSIYNTYEFEDWEPNKVGAALVWQSNNPTSKIPFSDECITIKVNK